MFQYDTNQFACLCYPRQKKGCASWIELLFFNFATLVTTCCNHPQAGGCSMFPERVKQFDVSRAKSTTDLGLLALFFAQKKFHNLSKEWL